jgi:phospholipid-binding lipoprotein MlaA
VEKVAWSRKTIFIVILVILIPSFTWATNDLPDDILEEDNQKLQDRLERVNRKIFAFNNALDRSFFATTSKIYLKLTFTRSIRGGIRGVLDNLNEPKNMVNHLLSGNYKGFFKASLRFLINSTLGLGGFFDRAGKKGLPRESLDFSSVLAKELCWKNGTYLMIPVLGPSTARNSFGLLIDRLMIDPLNYLLPFPWTFSKFFLEVVMLKEAQVVIMKEISHLSLDSYAALMSLYSQSDLAKEYN